MRITVLVAPFQPDPNFPSAVGPRRFYAVDEFAGALGQAAKTHIDVIEGELRDAPVDSYVISFAPLSTREIQSIGTRVILINVDRSAVPGCLERDRLAGAVEKDRYFSWQTNRANDRGNGLFARKDVTGRMGATLATPFQTEHYGLVVSSPYSDLPSLIVAYLDACDALENGDVIA